MKTQYVAKLQDGDKVNDYFVAVRKDVRTMNSGGKFLGMVFKDKTGEIGGIMWNNAVTAAKMFEVGDVVNVRGTITSYQERLQIRADTVLPLKEGEYDTDDLIFVPVKTIDAFEELRKILDTVENEWLRKLIDSFLCDSEFTDRFKAAAAGKKWHHSYRGGLAQHCYEMARIALTMIDLFPNIDRDVMLTAVLVHDIGKLDEMSHEMVVDYTTAGKLVGHLQMGSELVGKKADSIEGFPESLRLQLQHCIISHHGELINGSPIVPKTLEAMVLYLCDNLDAQTDAFTRVIGETKDKGQSWSDYLPLIERQIWTKGE